MSSRPNGAYAGGVNFLEMSLSAAALALCLCGAGLVRRWFRKVSLVYLQVYLLLTALGFVMTWLLGHPHTPYKAAWLAIFMASSFLLAPCLWLFALETVSNRPPRLRCLSLPEWVLILLGVLLTAPLFFAAHAGPLLVDPGRPATTPFAWAIHPAMFAAVLLFLVQAPWYLRAAVGVVRAQRERDHATFSNIEDMPLRVLRVLVWLIASVWLLTLARIARAAFVYGPTVLDPVFTCLSAGITLWALFTILRHCMYVDAEPRFAAEEAGARPKYVRSALDAETRERVRGKLQQALETDCIYTRSDLTLRDLSGHCRERPHYVSQVINEDLQTSFYDLVNRYRVAAAQERLLEYPHIPVLDIALRVGFNSKSPFNAAFKRVTGMTPTAYRTAGDAPESRRTLIR